MRVGRIVATTAAATLLAFALAGCVQGPRVAPTPLPLPDAPSATPTSTNTPAPVATFNPDGSAAANLAYFNKVGHALLDSHESSDGETIVNWFVAHGFNKKAMEITPDKTSIGLQAWNIEFSVNMNGTCLIGQAGNVKFQSTAQPLLATGKCLIGQTRTINW
jgi:hypothetical protein